MKDAAQKLLEKAERAIQAAARESKAGDTEVAASRSYYAMFYIAEALLFEEGKTFKKHSAVHAAFGEHFVKTGKWDPKYHRWLLEAFEKRITSDYGIEASLSREDAGAMIEQAEDFLSEGRRYLTR